MFQQISTRRCPCHTRALESLILDFAGLRITTPIHTLGRTRYISSQHFSRQLSVTAGNSSSKRAIASSRGSSIQGSFEIPAKKSNRSAKDWSESGSRSYKSNPHAKRDNKNNSRKQSRNAEPAAPKEIVEPGRSAEKTLSRLKRKQRRIEAGKFGTQTTADDPQSSETKSAPAREVVRSRIQEKIEAAVRKVDEKHSSKTAVQAPNGNVRRLKRSGDTEIPVQDGLSVADGYNVEFRDSSNMTSARDVEQSLQTTNTISFSDSPIPDEDVDGAVVIHRNPSTDGSSEDVGESRQAVLKRIATLDDSSIEDLDIETPSLLFGMEGEMPNPNQKFAKDKTPAWTPYKPRPKEPWQVQKAALQEKFGQVNWEPRKRLSPDSLNGIRTLHASDPGTYTTAVLANHFQVSPEAIRRILKSKWRPNEDEARDRLERWERRGARKWADMAAVGLRPPRRWRAMGIQQRGIARRRMRRQERPLPRVVDPKGFGGVRVNKSMDGVIAQRADPHESFVSDARRSSAGPTVGAETEPVAGSFAGRIL